MDTDYPYKTGPCAVVTVSLGDLAGTDDLVSVVEEKSVAASGMEGDGSVGYMTVDRDHMARTLTVYGADLSNAVVVSVAVPR